jgi:hypothetical protein
MIRSLSKMHYKEMLKRKLKWKRIIYNMMHTKHNNNSNRLHLLLLLLHLLTWVVHRTYHPLHQWEQ